jgi:hypothetical protein
MPWTVGGATRAVASAIAVGLFAPGTVLAQQTDVGFNVGFYNPNGALVQRGSKGDGTGTYLQLRQQNTLALGANVIVWPASKFGIAGSIAFSPTDVARSDSNGTHDFTSSVLLASVRAIYAFTPMRFKPLPGKRETPWGFYVGLGVGIANRSGAIWAYSSGLTSPALILDLGTQTAVGSRAILRFDIEDYLSRAQFDKGLSTQTDARIHNDVLFSLTVSYRVMQ